MGLVADIRLAVRGLHKAPGFALVVILSLGVGIGATTTVYTWIDSFLLRPFPAVRESNRLVGVYTMGPGGAQWSLSYPRYRRWREAASAVDGLVVYGDKDLSLRTDQFGPARVFAEMVSGNYFDVLGMLAVMGRTLTPKDEQDVAQVAVISQGLWQRAFQKDRSVIGRQVTLNGQGFTIVGVAPSGFGGTLVGLGFDLWVPVTTVPIVEPGNGSLTADGWQWFQALARLKPGMNETQAALALREASKRVSASLGETTPTIAGVRPLAQEGAGKFVGPLFYTLLGISIVLLLIACANIANLLLVRSVRRTKEISIRLAIGASRGRVIRQLLAESLVLAVAGGVVGLLFAMWGRHGLNALMPPLPYPVTLTGSFNGRVVLAALVLTAGTGLLVGLLPALKASRPSLLPALKDEQVPGTGRSLLRSGLVVAQVALSLVALVAAGLFTRSLSRSKAADPGFTGADRLLVLETSTRLAGLTDSAGAVTRDRLLDAVKQVPGVRGVSVATDVPMSIGGHSSNGITLEGYTPGRDENMSIETGTVSAGYFALMGIPMRRGRGITEADRRDAPPVVVVNEAFAKRFSPEQDPVGRRLRATRNDWLTIIGVAADVKMESIGEAPYPYYYTSMAQDPSSAFSLVIRTATDPKAIVEPVRGAFASVDPNLPLLDPRTMTENMAGAMFVQSTGASLLGMLGVLALALATIGLYAVLSYLVSYRTREIGIRVALGAETGRVVRLVVRQGLVLTALGLVIGSGLALLVGRALASQLIGVSPSDPLTFVTIPLALLGVAAGASLLPARRAARVDPVTALRSE